VERAREELEKIEFRVIRIIENEEPFFDKLRQPLKGILR
jgi:hypothetical protein